MTDPRAVARSAEADAVLAEGLRTRAAYLEAIRLWLTASVVWAQLGDDSRCAAATRRAACACDRRADLYDGPVAKERN